jgi:hypothetical protein
MRIPSLFFLALMCSCSVVDGCKNSPASQGKDKPSSVQFEPHLQEGLPPTVLFDLKMVAGVNGSVDSQLYDCSYTGGGKTARFRLQFRQKGPMSGEIPMASAEGKFLAVANSDNSVLLQDLKKALEAKETPKKYSRIVELSFDAVILAQRQSRDSSGGYSDKPPGDWMMVKVFLPKGGDDGEIFLNLNPVLGKAEFSIKDSDYGDYLLAQFAKVL